MKISDIFDVFSKRNRLGKKDLPIVPVTFRRKIVMLCDEVFVGEHIYYSAGNYSDETWSEIHRSLLLRHGLFRLSEHARTERDDVVHFILSCSNEEFWDFAEYIFKTQNFWKLLQDPNELVSAINAIMVADNIAYELTSYQTEEVEEEAPFPINRSQKMTKVIRVVSYPQVICKDDLYTHDAVLKPTLTLLSDRRFSSAYSEFLEALEDYRKTDYSDCVIKCCSSFESTMKIICKQKNWPYDSNKDTASRLVKIIIEKSGLDPSFQAQFEAIGTMRNRLSMAHGAGPNPRVVDKFIAQYAINTSASAILFLVNKIM
jgi:hypothetical protein